VFDRIFAALAAEAGPPSRLMLDATHLKAHRTVELPPSNRTAGMGW
jgi:hypothetical protein